jgi:lipid-A-disaccharide synthase-like uncharacterized protein
MAEENIKDFTINWMVTGFLTICLVSFSIAFMVNNNPLGFGSDSQGILNSSDETLSSRLEESLINSNTILNITANTNPEASDLGSRDSVATAYKSKESAMSHWEASKMMISWVFSGTIGEMLITLISAILGFLSIYYIVKYIRNGI